MHDGYGYGQWTSHIYSNFSNCILGNPIEASETVIRNLAILTLLHSERPNLYVVFFAFPSAKELKPTI